MVALSVLATFVERKESHGQALPVFVWIPPIDCAIGSDFHWISSKSGS